MRYPKIRSKMTISLKTNQGFPTLNSMDRPRELQEPGLCILVPAFSKSLYQYLFRIEKGEADQASRGVVFKVSLFSS